ncbi:hypothetical protein [Paenibacillus harenae]|uniref:hypothetical protein n=1 Tax=Paenibacillus harenae TaxID=306543 RepID=UPI0004272539|nr:hypothetical protein [Paenibacillus harenae]
MKRSKAMTAGAIALTLTLGGGGLWATTQYVNAAATVDSGNTQSQNTETEAGTQQKDPRGKRGGFGHGFRQIQEQLLTYLGLEEEALRTKLETLTLAEAAVEQGKTREELKAKLVEWLEAAEAARQADTEADEQQDDTKALNKPDAATLADKLLDSKGFGFGKHGAGGKSGFGGNLDSVASALSLTVEELRAEVTGGKTIAAIATEKGIAVQTVIDAMVSGQKTKLSEKLASGTITQEQYDERLAAAVEHATKHVNGELPLRGEGGKGGPGGKGPRGERPGEPATDGTSADETAADDFAV